ncbi:MAG: heparan-alpha-glucosaminide N-acetyltransferase domain-containing protein [Candidatus Krumholzibacteriia bacterium]
MHGRIASVDVLRGLTMAAMVVVNNPGSWAHMAPGLRHAPWGAVPTPADFVFPFFLVLVGVSTPLALRRRIAQGQPTSALLARATRRALTLAAIGILLNLFPGFDLATVRLPGVLQRIALVSLACAAAFLWLRPRSILGLIALLLVGYTLILRLVPVPGLGVPTLTPAAHLPAWLDDRVFGAHTWRGPGDPEGLLSSLGAVATGLIGVLAGTVLAGRWTPRQQAGRLLGGGAATLAAGAASTLMVPLAKDVWTASYALVTGGAALLALGGLQLWLGARGDPSPGPVLRASELFGRQALLAYVLAHLLSDVTISVLRWPGGSLHALVYRGLLASWLPDVAASLVFSLLMLAAVWGLVAWAERRGWRLRT